MNFLLFASWSSPQSASDWVRNVLAVAGGALIGGLLSGLILQVLVRAYTGGKVPTWLLQTVRVVGAAVLAWIVFMVLFTAGGPGGPGGPGLPGNGNGNGSTAPTATNHGPAVTAPTQTAPASKDTARAENRLRIEVLSGPQTADRHFYRVQGEERLLNLSEVKQLVEKRLAQAPPLQKVEIVLYENSPDEGTEAVANLDSWIRQKGISTGIEKVAGNAP